MAENILRRFMEPFAKWAAPLFRGADRRKLLVFLYLAVGGAVLLLLFRPAPRGAMQPTAGQTAPRAGGDWGQYRTEPEIRRLERELAGILGQIAGAGRVRVSLTLATSSGSQWEENRRRNRRTVENRGQDGSVEITTEETEETTLALARRADGSEAPIGTLSTAARVAGAIVVADGAQDPAIRANLARAAAVYLGLGLHRIMVFAREAETE